MQVKCFCKYDPQKQFENSVLYMASCFCSYACVFAFHYNLSILLGLYLIWMPFIICHGRSKVENLCLMLFCILLCSELSSTSWWLLNFCHYPQSFLWNCSHLLSHPLGIFMWLSNISPNMSCLKLNSFSILCPQPNCSLFSAVPFHWLYYHSPSSFITLRKIFHVSKVSSLVLFIF